MALLSKSAVLTILGYLDAAGTEAAKVNPQRRDSDLQWNIRKARDWLLRAALVDVEIEPLARNAIELSEQLEHRKTV